MSAPKLTRSCCVMHSGAATKFWLGGRILVRQIHLPPKFDFSSDFGHFILKILKKSIFLLFPFLKILKIAISVGTSPFMFLTGGTRPPRPPVSGLMVTHHQSVQNKPLAIFFELVRESSFLSCHMSSTSSAHVHLCPLDSPAERNVPKLSESTCSTYNTLSIAIFHSSI